MMRRQHTRVALSVVLVLVMLALAACDGGAFEANDLLMTWLTEQPVDEQLENTTGRTGDRAVDGILTAAKTLEDIQQADDWYWEAQDRIDVWQIPEAENLLDEAIQLRPDDMRYRRDRAMLAIREGQTLEALEHWSQQDRIARENDWDLDQNYWLDAELDVVIEQERLEAEPQSQDRDAELAAVYSRLSELYLNWSSSRARVAGKGGEELEAKADEYAARAAALEP